ncbi:MAG: hypothetical protein LBP59_04645, partial [Planctomycetaceae bacterium]|nr:hypothetical protein [Planctomycetaceae bacterium]
RDARDPLVPPASGCTQPLIREVDISTAFLFALRQSAGETPAIRWSRLLVQVRRRHACKKKECRR